MDRRVHYTRLSLNNSLLKYLNEKPLAKITVTEICKEADVNRSTYYSHFTDPFDQFVKLKTQMLQEATEYAKKIDAKQLSADQHRYRVLLGILQYVDSKRSAFKTLLSINGDHSLQHEILTILGRTVFLMDDELFSSNSDSLSLSSDFAREHIHYKLLFAANGCFGMFYHWLMDETPASADQVARMMVEFTKHLEF